MPIATTSQNYVIIEAEDGDVSSLVSDVNNYIDTNNWAAVGGVAVKQNGNLIQVLARKSLL